MKRELSPQSGFSMLEMIVVVSIVAILTLFAVATFRWTFKSAADNQAKILVDVLDEARQKSLNQRKTFRVEINRTRNQIRLIDEGRDATTANDDVEVKRVPISADVTIGAAPSNVSGAPAATSPIPNPTFATSNYPLSNGDSKITLRFRRNGQVVDTGTDNVGTGSVMSGATIYVANKGDAPDVIRAVTVLGTTGDTSIFRCRVSGSTCSNWAR